jgi:CheY-like chemotaxis protein
MIHRAMGEGVELVTQLKTDLWPIKADPSHLEQVVMNLAVNARDAMSGKGRLTITTDNVTLDQDFVKTHANVAPGDYVLLAAKDSGCGMTEEVKARIFEPFFTTKEVGKGTGLGLATCYGIIKGSGGHIFVESKPGSGTTFQIYLPRTEAPKEAGTAEEVRKAPRGTETILWVEDDAALRVFVTRTLRELGYCVLEAADAKEAYQLLEKHRDEKVSLLIADVLLPAVSGKDMADQIKGKRPDIKTLFTSGYADEVLAQHGVLKPEIEILRKPFWPVTLALKVRAVLDGS